MRKYNYSLIRNARSMPLKGKVLLLFKSNDMLDEVSKKIGDFNYQEIVESDRKAVSFTKTMDSEISTIYTDVKRLASGGRSYDVVYVESKREDNEITIINNTSNEVEIYPENKIKVNIMSSCKVIDVLKKANKVNNKIIEVNSKGVSLMLKVNGLWKNYDYDYIKSIFLTSKNLKPKSDFFGIIPLELKKNKKTDDKILFNGEQILFGNNKEANTDIVNWLISDDLSLQMNEIINSNGNFITESKSFLVKNENITKDFINSMISKKDIKGLEYSSIEKLDENIYRINTKYGFIILQDLKKKVKLNSFFNSMSPEFDLSHFASSTMKNISHILKQEVKPNRLSRKDVIKSVLGILIFILLCVLTFRFLFTMDNMADIFKYLFTFDNFKDPWIYFIILSFIFTLLQPMIVAIFIQKFIVKKEVNREVLITYYISGTLRHISSFLTGNYILSMFVWGWYLNRKLNIKASSLVGTVSMAAIVRAIVYSVIGTFFMIMGTLSFYSKYYIPGSGGVIAIFVISWIGFVWELIHKSWLFLIILIPAFQVWGANLILWTKKTFNRIKINDYNKMYNNILLLRKTSPRIDFAKERIRFIRAAILITLPIIVESIETVLYFDVVDSFALRQSGNFSSFSPYYNFIDTSGLRLVVANLKNFPLLRALPGKGMFIDEFGLINLYEQIYSSAHTSQSIWGAYSSHDLAEMTTFITRLFNVYLLMIIRIIIILFVLFKSIFRRRHA